MLKRLTRAQAIQANSRRVATESDVLARAAEIVDSVRRDGWDGLIRWSRELDRTGSERWVWMPADFAEAWARTPAATQGLLQRTADRIRRFAELQRDSLRGVARSESGARMGWDWHPLRAAGCYVPGGRYPLVSSLLMTAVTARAAAVESVWVACPAPRGIMLAAAHVAGVDGLLAAGGAHAIATLAYGAGEVPASDVVVGPGNVWVTAAKQIVSADVKIDMLAGPSELVILADETANPAWIAADLLAQAEHDRDARPILVTTCSAMHESVNRELELQLKDLPSAETASAALQNGFAIVAENAKDALAVCEQLAPEHLELHLADAESLRHRMRGCGCLFIGEWSAEVLGDYGAGPNHVLPTGGTARFASGLSAATFMRTQTWLAVDDEQAARALAADARDFAVLEGLPGHARSAEIRLTPPAP